MPYIYIYMFSKYTLNQKYVFFKRETNVNKKKLE